MMGDIVHVYGWDGLLVVLRDMALEQAVFTAP